jgi:2-hydroxy-3-keto-5-methylthiopentenyl-1-phosphate phosphatase
MLILCDFDGTITLEDVTNCIWDHYHGPEWREWLLPDYRAGKTTTLQVMAGGFKPIRAPLAEMLAIAERHKRLREGFRDFAAFCKKMDWPLYVVSCGLDVYIKAYLPEGIPFISYEAVLEDGWQVRLPADVSLQPGDDFKIHALKRLREKHPGRETVFIGDGRNDFPISGAVDRVFAKSESTLERLCKENTLAHHSFDDFHGILAQLRQLE